MSDNQSVLSALNNTNIWDGSGINSRLHVSVIVPPNAMCTPTCRESEILPDPSQNNALCRRHRMRIRPRIEATAWQTSPGTNGLLNWVIVGVAALPRGFGDRLELRPFRVP
jgi:hypothetical protein